MEDYFAMSVSAEGVDGNELFHIGDNRHSDGDMPALAGHNAVVRPRSQVYIASRALDSALFQATLNCSPEWAYHPKPAPELEQSPHTQKRMVLGPLVAEYCLRLWLYLSCASQDGRSVALFCARGGIGQRIAFERFLARTGLKLEMRRENLRCLPGDSFQRGGAVAKPGGGRRVWHTNSKEVRYAMQPKRLRASP